MKTALTELIEKWESEMGSYIPNTSIYKAFIDEVKTFLEKEKEQIQDAYTNGAIDFQGGSYEFTSGDEIEYFQKTYNGKI